jgi:hybrid cluster-associated redox disulfide protein
VFLDFKFMCVGCPIACFHSVEDACREHKAELDAFLQALNAITLEAALASHNA